MDCPQASAPIKPRFRETAPSAIPPRRLQLQNLLNHPALADFEISTLDCGWIGGASNPREVIEGRTASIQAELNGNIKTAVLAAVTEANESSKESEPTRLSMEGRPMASRARSEARECIRSLPRENDRAELRST